MLRTCLAALVLLTPHAVSAQAIKPKPATASDKAYDAAMDRMMQSMHVKPTGDADRDFATMMLPHHQGAVDMAQVEIKYGKDPALLAMARAIVESQTKEIGELREWLKAHGR